MPDVYDDNAILLERGLTEVGIGITGLSGTGKDTAASFLLECARTLKIKTDRYQLSDVIRDEISKREGSKVVGTRDLLIRIGNQLRENYGEDILANRIIEKHSIVDGNKQDDGMVVFVGIRNPLEAIAFSSYWGSDFLLLAIKASEPNRLTRKASRSQYQEDEIISSRIETEDRNIGIDRCEKMADCIVYNNDGIQSFKQGIENLFESKIIPMLRLAKNA